MAPDSGRITLFRYQAEECSHLFEPLKQEGPFLFYTEAEVHVPGTPVYVYTLA